MILEEITLFLFHKIQRTYASVPSFDQLVIRRALAYVFPLGIYTCAVLARLRILAFVDIRAISARAVQLVSLVALATEHAEYILATAEHAQVAEHLALASKRSRIIEAVAILAKGVVVGAFVDVFTGVAVPSEPSVAIALRTSVSQLSSTVSMNKLSFWILNFYY